MSSNLFLSREGVFPIVRGLDGAPLSTATGLNLSGTVQGEGKWCGTSALFVRLQGCNLKCRWQLSDGATVACDTAHTWSSGGTACPVSDVAELVRLNIGRMRHVVITGGEPCLQPEAVVQLIDMLHRLNLKVTVETNGSLFNAVAQMPDLLSLSPKLSSSGISRQLRAQTVSAVRSNVLAALDSGHDVQLKFVVSSQADEDEILNDYAGSLSALVPDDVVVMPLGVSDAQLKLSTPLAVNMAIRNGWRFGPRLHISLFGNKEAT